MTIQISTIVFLSILIAVFQFSPGRMRKFVLLLASTLFIYVEGGVLGLVSILLVTAYTWLMGKCLFAQRQDSVSEKIVMVLSISVLVMILAGWKYVPLLALKAGYELNSGVLSLPVPIGLSFYTFQAISYIADIYTGKLKENVGISDFVLYMIWFPKWMSGPIERAGTFVDQLQYQGNIRAYSLHRVTHAASFIVWGLVLKLMVADKVATVVDAAFADMGTMGPFTLMLVSVLYTIQIYCDFAGYTDIAIGVSKLFGIDLTKNFNTPYMAENIVDFWRRWHISLSGFLRDYVYIPLGGNRKGAVRKHINTVIVFFICGMWHGAGLSFIVWGMIHGGLNVVAGILKKTRLCFLLKGNLGRVITFCFVSFAWIFFRAPSLSQALLFVKEMVPSLNPNGLFSGLNIQDGILLGLDIVDWWIAGITILFITVCDAFSYNRDTVPPVAFIERLSDNKRLVLLSAAMAVILIFGEYGAGSEIRKFVYMNF